MRKRYDKTQMVYTFNERKKTKNLPKVQVLYTVVYTVQYVVPTFSIVSPQKFSVLVNLVLYTVQ